MLFFPPFRQNMGKENYVDIDAHLEWKKESFLFVNNARIFFS
jgi:hypothetical protein